MIKQQTTSALARLLTDVRRLSPAAMTAIALLVLAVSVVLGARYAEAPKLSVLSNDGNLADRPAAAEPAVAAPLNPTPIDDGLVAALRALYDAGWTSSPAPSEDGGLVTGESNAGNADGAVAGVHTRKAPASGVGEPPLAPSGKPSGNSNWLPAGEPIQPIAAATATAQPPRTPTPLPFTPTPTRTPPPAAGSRDKYTWPFAATSIWNMPIGSGAVYVPAGIQTANAWQGEITTDDEYIGLNPADPLRSLNGGTQVHVPSGMSADGSWNGVAAFLTQDGRVAQGQPLVLSAGGNPSWQYPYPTVDLYGDGIDGAHGGSGMSSFGGSIRKGELSSADPLRHALKVNLYAKRFLSFSGGACYRWPARRCDAYASSSTYGGGVSALRMGALLALRPDVNVDALGLQSAQARKIARALQDYGAYVVDDTAWDVHAIDIERGAEFGDGGSFHSDLQRVFTMLNVVDNNSATAIGGGGTPRASLAPAFGN